MTGVVVCPAGRKRQGLAPLLKAGAWLNLSGGKEEGKEASPEHCIASWVLTGGLMERGPTQGRSFARLGRTQLRSGGGCSESSASPLWQLRWLPGLSLATRCLAQPAAPRHSISWARAMLVPRWRVRALRAHADHKTQQREQRVCPSYCQRQRTCPQSLPRLCSIITAAPPLHSTKSCASSEAESENFLSCILEGTGVLSFSEAQGGKKQTQMKKRESTL